MNAKEVFRFAIPILFGLIFAGISTAEAEVSTLSVSGNVLAGSCEVNFNKK